MNRILRNMNISILLLAFLAGSAAYAQAPDRTHSPEPGPAPTLHLAAIKHLKLSNGLAVTLMEKHEVPLVQIEMLVKVGPVNDPAGKGGLSSMTSDMMMNGAGSRGALELSDAIDFLGASINVGSGMHDTYASLHTPLSKLDSSLALFADVVLRPTFPPAELDRQRDELLTNLAQMHDNASAISSFAFNKIIFGDRHPYGIPTSGTEQSIRSFTTDDLKKFHDTFFRPNNADLIVVGDVTPDAIMPKLEAAFGAWKTGEIPAVTFPEETQVTDRKLYLIDKPGATQSVIRIGRLGVERATPDYYAIQVMNTILGGSFTSRLNMNLRETHGYTYGAGSGFDFRPLPGAFSARASVQTAVTDKSLTEFFNELNGILKPVSESELERAKNYLTLRYPENFETVEQITGQLIDLVTYNLPNDYFDNYAKNISTVSLQDVNRVARKYIDPEKVAIVVVGDRSVIEKGIQALNLAPIQNMTIDGVLGKAPVVGEK